MSYPPNDFRRIGDTLFVRKVFIFSEDKLEIRVANPGGDATIEGTTYRLFYMNKDEFWELIKFADESGLIEMPRE